MRTPRRRSREFAIQALYQALLNPEYSVTEIINNIKETDPFAKALAGKKPKVDELLFYSIVEGVLNNLDNYKTDLVPYLDRNLEEVNLIELSILLMASHELQSYLEIPYPVIINEAIELTKAYAKDDSYKFINGVLDRMAIAMRPNDNFI